VKDAVSIANAEHYVWGDGCDGWHLLRDPQLSVIRERVPPGKGEVLHSHDVAQQFFYIISGHASVELDGRLVQLDASTGRVQHTADMVPDGCTGGSIWGSPTVDEAEGALYVATGNPDPCSRFGPQVGTTLRPKRAAATAGSSGSMASARLAHSSARARSCRRAHMPAPR